MGIDINLLRADKGGDPAAVRESERKRGNKTPELVDLVIRMDEDWRKARFQADAINKEINSINKQFGALAKAKKVDTPEAVELKAQKAELEAKKAALNKASDELEAELNKKLNLIGNIVHPSCIDSCNEDDNAIVRKWWPEGRHEAAELATRASLIKEGAVGGVPGLYSQHEVLEMLDGYDPVRGAKVAGHRGYFLSGVGVDLNLALIQYGLNFLQGRGFTKLWTPFFMRREVMAKTAQLEEFDEALYKVEGEAQDGGMYLIATSEQPISAFHMNEWFNDSDLPKKYAGQSTCFRKEAGAHGRDTWGIFRVHQFEKIEQFVLTHPEKSWEMHEEMLKNAQDFYESLKIPYRVVSIVAGALNNAAAKKYDLEAYFPFKGEYKELVSCSNCTDYQSRALEIRYGMKTAVSAKQYVHALNCTLTATERTICCILENYQTPDGLVIPEVLRPYMGNVEFIPWKKQKNLAKAMNDVRLE